MAPGAHLMLPVEAAVADELAAEAARVHGVGTAAHAAESDEV